MFVSGHKAHIDLLPQKFTNDNIIELKKLSKQVLCTGNDDFQNVLSRKTEIKDMGLAF